MEAIAQDQSINKRKRQRRDRVSTAELYTALEGLLPAAEIEIESRASYIEDFPEDDDHASDVEFVQHGQAAIALATELIARKTGNIRRKQRLMRETQGQTDA